MVHWHCSALQCALQGRAGPDQARAGNPTGRAGQGRGGLWACASSVRPAPCCCCCLAAGFPGDMGPLPALLWPATALPGAAFNSAAAPYGQAAARKNDPSQAALLPALAGDTPLWPAGDRGPTGDCADGLKAKNRVIVFSFFGKGLIPAPAPSKFVLGKSPAPCILTKKVSARGP